MGWYRWDATDLILRIHLQPRASRDAFADIAPDFVRVRVTAPPVDGQANAHLQWWLADRFGVARSAVRLERGATSRCKQVRIQSPSRLPLPGLRHD
jgi:uncharacterized protein (TIGR00251 family)